MQNPKELNKFSRKFARVAGVLPNDMPCLRADVEASGGHILDQRNTGHGRPGAATLDEATS